MPRKVIALDYSKRGDLYIRFKYVEKPIGEPTEDGLAVIFYEDSQNIAAVEILDVKEIARS